MRQTAVQRFMSENGKKGGAARALALTAARRIEIARLGGLATAKLRKDAKPSLPNETVAS